MGLAYCENCGVVYFGKRHCPANACRAEALNYLGYKVMTPLTPLKVTAAGEVVPGEKKTGSWLDNIIDHAESA